MIRCEILGVKTSSQTGNRRRRGRPVGRPNTRVSDRRRPSPQAQGDTKLAGNAGKETGDHGAVNSALVDDFLQIARCHQHDLSNAKPRGRSDRFRHSLIGDLLSVFGIGLDPGENTLVLGRVAHGFIGKSSVHGAVLVGEA